VDWVYGIFIPGISEGLFRFAMESSHVLSCINFCGTQHVIIQYQSIHYLWMRRLSPSILD